MTWNWPFAGFTENCTFAPPVSTPISVMTARAASRRRWYSRSVSVIAGAIVIESPVWTPIGSMFSNRADDDEVVGPVTHDLELELLPAEDALLDEHFARRRLRERPGDLRLELAPVLRDASARAAHREGRPEDRREARLFDDLPGLLDGVGRARARTGEADLLHRGLEERAILGLRNRFGTSAEHLDAVLLQDAPLVEREREVQRRLTAERGEDRRGLLPLDDGLERARLERLHVRPGGEARVRHDGGWVRVHQDDVVALVAQGLCALRSGIVELASLADDDWPGADDEDFLEVVAARHRIVLPSAAPSRLADGLKESL